MLRIIFGVFIFTLCQFLQAINCSAIEAPPNILSLSKSGLAVGVQLEEYGKITSRKISVTPMFEPVNPDATLAVTFPPPQDISPHQGYPEWEQLDRLLTSLNALAESRKRHVDLMVAVDSGQLQRQAEFERSSEDFDDQYDNLDNQARQVLGPQLYAKLDAEALDRSSAGVRFVDILGEWIKKRREELSDQTAGIVLNAKSSATVTIQVFHETADGATKVLHVDPYDNIPIGVLTSNPKTELGLSASEYARLAKGFELSNSVAQEIDQFGKNIQETQDKLHGLAGTLNKRLLAFANSFEEKGKLWQQRIATVDLLLEALAKEKEPVATKAKAVQVSITPLTQDIKKISESISAIRSLQDQLHGKGLSLVLFSQGIAIGEDINVLIANSKKWSEKTKDLQNKIADLTSAVSATEKQETLSELDQLKSDVLAQISKSKEEIGKLIPDGFNALLVAAQQETADIQKNESVYHEMAAADCKTIPHDLSSLVPGIIKLKPAGVRPDDIIKIRVTLSNPAASEEKTLEYQLKVRYVGLHLGYSGQLVFVAPLRGLQKNTFQASAAVLGTWKYGVEKPVGLKKLWYRMDPGWGLHVVALNQGSGTTETGLGVSASLWGDLVTAGYGWNVGIKGSPKYYFVGVGLLELLQQFRKISPNGQ